MNEIRSNEGASDVERDLRKVEELLVRLEKLGISIQRLEEFLDAIQSFSKEPSKIRYYLMTYTKLKKLEKEFGKSIGSLLKEYEKKARELVTLEYSIDELKKKRKRIEEDMELYMQQNKLTLELVSKVNALLLALRNNGLEVEDLERFVSLISMMKDLGKPERMIEQIRLIGDLNREIDTLSKKLLELKSEIEQRSSERDRLLEECAKLLNVKGELDEVLYELDNLRTEKKRLQDEVEEMKRLKSSLLKEYSTLLEVKGSIEDVLSGIKRKEEELRSLEEEISKKQALLAELESDLNAVRAFTMMLSDPKSCQPEDVQALIQQLNNILKIKRGELSVLKPLESYLLEKARRRLVELMMPALSNEMVPKWVFERLEKQFESLVERRAKLEEEIRILKELLKQQPPSQSESEKKASAIEEATFFTISGSGARIPESPSGKKARVICKQCKAGTLVWLPSMTELDKLYANKQMLELKCSSCGAQNVIDPVTILKLYHTQR